MKISFDGKTLERVDNSDLNYEGEFEVPQGITKISKNAFTGSQLKFLTVADSVTEIWDGAFSGCTNLISIKLPKSLKN